MQLGWASLLETGTISANSKFDLKEGNINDLLLVLTKEEQLINKEQCVNAVVKHKDVVLKPSQSIPETSDDDPES